MTDLPSTSGRSGSRRSSGSSGTRGNPAPRRALARVRPLDPEEGPAQAIPTAAAHAPTGETTSPAAAPGGTEGRDLLIPGRSGDRRHGRGAGHGKAGAKTGKGGRAVPSLADLMPPSAPSGRRTARVSQEAVNRVPGAGSDPGKAKTVELVVTLPKPLRKRLKARAAELGVTPEEAVAQLVEVWVDG